ncbi:class I adenylate-forming enzyme family protein [Bacillus cereus group sp. BfR-BA-01358]|uniref:AMP-binding protein n=1 Tax=Bacillus cereus group sp. BfR-BA-01358 TaxID=2920320 RepID=UPI001F55DCD4|nr:class I adenylate-forming enzyme family protein [Bacillus cereus group sp. BfR-BA-01358]
MNNSLYKIPFCKTEIEEFLNQIIDSDNTENSVEFDEILNKIVKTEIKPGSVILIALPNSKTLVQYYFATLLAGGVPTLLSPSTSSRRIMEIANSLGATAIIAPKLADFVSYCEKNYSIGDFRMSFFNLLNKKIYSPGDVIILTSGTSGILSGCLHNINSLICNAQRHTKSVNLVESDILLINLPLYYSYAMVAQMLAAFVRKCRLVISGPPFTPKNYISLLEKYKITISSITPLLVKNLLKSNCGIPNSLKTLTVGGDFLNPTYTQQLLNLYPNLELYLTYGLTEAGPRVATLAAHNEPVEKFLSVGLPMEGVEVSLKKLNIDDNSGELIITSDTILKKKVGRDFKGNPIVGPNTIATGDLFEIDLDGYLYFKGRISDFIITNGEKISLSSIRNLINSLPGVYKVTTQPYQVEEGEYKYDLNIYIDNEDLYMKEELKKNIYQLLLRNERPYAIRVYPAQAIQAHK